MASNRGWHYGWGRRPGARRAKLGSQLDHHSHNGQPTLWSTNTPQLQGHDHRQTALKNPEDLAHSGLTPHQRASVQGGNRLEKFESVFDACKQRR